MINKKIKKEEDDVEFHSFIKNNILIEGYKIPFVNTELDFIKNVDIVLKSFEQFGIKVDTAIKVDPKNKNYFLVMIKDTDISIVKNDQNV